MLGDVLNSQMLFDKIFNLMYFNDLELIVEYNVRMNKVLIRDNNGKRFNDIFHINLCEFNEFKNDLSELKAKLVNLNNFNSIDVKLIE